MTQRLGFFGLVLLTAVAPVVLWFFWLAVRVVQLGLVLALAWFLFSWLEGR